MGKHNRPVDGVAEALPIDPVPSKMKKTKKHKDKHGSSDKSASEPQPTSKDSKSSTKKRKREKKDDPDDCNHDVSPSDNTHPNPTDKPAASPSSPPAPKKHKKQPKSKSSDKEITLTEMLLQDREIAKRAEAKAAEAARKQAEAEEREAANVLAEKAARKARKADKKERKRRAAELKSKSAPVTGRSSPADGEGAAGKGAAGKGKEKAKRSVSGGVDGITSPVEKSATWGGKATGGKVGQSKPKATVEDVAERWNVGGLEGGSSRQSKFMRLLGAKKAGITAPVVEVAKPGEDKTAKMADELERQFDAGRRMKYESGGQKKGLGA